MNKVLGIVAVVWLCGLISMCQAATHAINFRFHNVDPAFKELTDEFYSALNKACPSKIKYQVNYYTIEFEDSPDPEQWVGICMPGINGYTIAIDRRYWKGLDQDIKRELMFHELSHCVIYRTHSDIKTNYMYPSIRPNLSPEVLDMQVVQNMQDYCNE